MKTNDFNASRRHFLKTALTAPVAIAAVPSLLAQNASAEGAPASASTPLPLRKLGRNDRQVTMLNIGGMEKALSPQYLDIAWASGIRYFDTADCYLGGKSETIVGEWLAKYPHRREELFLVTKDHPHDGPHQMLEMIDRRLEPGRGEIRGRVLHSRHRPGGIRRGLA